MQNDAIKLPNSMTGLIDLVREQQVALGHRDQKLEQQSQFIEQLLEQIRLARHQHFGTRSERFNIDQMALMFNEAEALLEQQFKEDSATSPDQKLHNDEIAVPAHKRSRGGRRPLPAELP